MDEGTDIQLMMRVRDGDEEAFRVLVARYRGPLGRFFRAILPDPSQAEDYVQETFMRLWLSRRRYEPCGVFSTYLFQIGKHHWMNQRRKAAPPVSFGYDDGVLEVRAPRRTQPEVALLQHLQAIGARRAVETLPIHLRGAFALRHTEGMPYAAIARCLDIPVGTVKSRLSEAMRRVRAALEEEEP